MLHPLMMIWESWTHVMNAPLWNPYGAGAVLAVAVPLIGYLVKSMLGRD